MPMQPRVQLVLQVAARMPFSISTVALRRRALVVHVERAAPAGQGAVVDHGAQLGLATRWPMRPANAEVPLRLKSAFEAVADRLVQQDAGPAGAEHDVHRAGRAGHRVEVDEREAHGFVDERLPERREEHAAELEATAAALRATSRRPCASSAITCTFRRTSGCTSATNAPSLAATSTWRCWQTTLAITCVMRGSRLARRRRSLEQRDLARDRHVGAARATG